MGAPSKEGVALRADVEQAVLAAAEKLGAEAGIDTAGIVRHFSGRGAADSTLFRWCREIIKSGKPGQHVAKQVKRAADRRVARSAAYPEAAAAEVRAELAATLPAVVRVDDVLGGAAGGKVVGVIDRLQRLMADLEMLIAHAKTEDGKVRNARLLGTSLEQMRRCLETGVRLHQAMRETDQVDRLQNAIIDAIAEESPELAARVYLKIDAIAANWGG
jgi:hypothetical protein